MSGQPEVSVRQVVNAAFADAFTTKIKLSVNKLASDIDEAKHTILEVQRRLNLEKVYDYESFISAVCKVIKSLEIIRMQRFLLLFDCS